MSRSAILATLFSCLCFAATAGCAAEATDGESSAASTDALMTDTLVGKYYDRAMPPGGIARINLEADGTYTASFDAAGTAMCITAPCLIPASGRWSTATGDDGVSLRLFGTPGAASRTFDVKKLEGQLQITTDHGMVQKLVELDADQCLDDGDCASDSVCSPRVCAMMCASGSPFCCGASLCRAKSAAAK